jgi:hypothetical protein
LAVAILTLAACFTAHSRLLQSGAYAPAWLLYRGDHNLDSYIRDIDFLRVDVASGDASEDTHPQLP